jgi:3-phenylpropionate/trans-cinnamate dioxygenase ferredoxin reductase subunit
MVRSGADKQVMIVGAGHAGGSAAAFLRQYGFEGAITLVGSEPVAPYQRPPLSKAWLKGEANVDALLLRPAAFYAGAGISLRLGAEVTALDLARREIRIDCEALGYDRLILATGARPRTLPVPGHDLQGVHVLRSMADAEALKKALAPGRRLAVVGGGYVGLEVAASARALGAEAVVIEREAKLLARVACGPLADFFQAYHQARGVDFVLGAQVTGFDGEGGRVAAVAFADGRRVACDLVVVGVGAVPNDELAQAAGLACRDGILVDEVSRTSDPAASAIGDCSRRPLPLYGEVARLESVPSALEQAKQAAADVCGRDQPPGETPWFWSDQYDLKLQIAGLPLKSCRTVVRGEPAQGRFAVFHLAEDGRIQCVEAVNSPAEFMGGRLLIGARTPVLADRLADAAVPMKAVAA